MSARYTLRRLRRILGIVAGSFYSWIWVNCLALANRLRTSPVTRPGGPVISLTTYGKRIRTVHFTIESIAQGKVLPSRLILWLDDAEAFANLPAALLRLQRRGLEIRFSKNYGPHTKYYPYLEAEDSFEAPLVTADDDQLYPRFWLKVLMDAFRNRPEVVNCLRARIIALNDAGLGKYTDWHLCMDTEPGSRVFATGVSGAIYPPSLLRVLKSAGSGFESCCPKADDLWLHVQALRAGFKARQIGEKALDFAQIPGTQDMALALTNVAYKNGNDQQAKATYSAADIESLRSETLPVISIRRK